MIDRVALLLELEEVDQDHRNRTDAARVHLVDLGHIYPVELGEKGLWELAGDGLEYLKGLVLTINVRKLREDWEAKGNPPCDHPDTIKEVIGWSKTGDLICTTCGYIGPRSEFSSRH